MNYYKIPTLADLYQDDETAWAHNEFKKLLNTPTPEAWIKTHKQTGIRYLPIDKVEFLLDRIYVGRWRREVLQVQLIVNSIQVTIRLHVFDPVFQEWTYQDGVGAMPIQLKQGSSPSDLANINHNAIQMNTPAAASYALKDAAQQLGKIFGRDITRKDTIAYIPSFENDPFTGNGETGAEVKEKTPPPPPPLPATVIDKIKPVATPTPVTTVTKSEAFNANLLADPGVIVSNSTANKIAAQEIDF